MASAVRALKAILWLSVLIAAVVVVCRLLAGDAPRLALQSTTLLSARKLVQPANNDSWGAMLSALQRSRDAVATSVYQRSLTLDQCKFQYPPSSLLVLELVQTPEDPVSCVSGGQPGAVLDGDNWPAKPWIDWMLRLGTLATMAVAVRILIDRLGPPAVRAAGATPAVWGLGLALGLLFYPLMNAYHLGQVQVLLNLCIAVALWCWLHGRPATAGVLIGLCCLFKPQYAVLLVWAGLRREWRFFAALAAVAVAGNALAVLHHGVAMHRHYLDLLGLLSQRGETYWANQTVNGMLNRLLMTASPTQFDPDGFPAYHPVVRWGTLLSSVALIGAALWPPGGLRALLQGPVPGWPGPDGHAHRAIDFAVAIAALTIASPIGWQHHYGCFLPIFALALAAMLQQPAPVAARLALGGAFLLVANAMLRDDLLFVHPIVGLLGSHLWLGAMLLLVLLWSLRGSPAAAHGAQQPGGTPAPIGGTAGAAGAAQWAKQPGWRR